MMKLSNIKSIRFIAFLQAVGVAAYVGLLVFLVEYIGGFMSRSSLSVSESVAPVILLLTFVISAAITGGLVLGYPILLFLEGRKKDAVMLFLKTVAFLILIAIIFVISGLSWSALGVV